MGEFSASWLALREPADVRARSAALSDEVLGHVRRWSPVMTAVDLGTGTGSNVRYLASRVRGRQAWVALDDDAGLLESLSTRMQAWAADQKLRVGADAGALTLVGEDTDCRVTTRLVNLATLFDTPAVGPFVFPSGALVTASALLDLVSPRWIDRLAETCRASGAAVLFALTYDGVLACTPELPGDDRVRALVNTHQRSDKGFGPALGPTATDYAEAALTRCGYHARRASSAWRIGPDEAPLQRALVEGWADAAAQMAPGEADGVVRWRDERCAFIDQGRSTLVVGHQDLAAWPAFR